MQLKRPERYLFTRLPLIYGIKGTPSRAGSVLGAPTAQELEALFEELEEMSDSDPGEFNDDVSIRSNPRPALRPYFTRSKEVLPVLFDQVGISLPSVYQSLHCRCRRSRIQRTTIRQMSNYPRMTRKLLPESLIAAGVLLMLRPLWYLIGDYTVY